MFTPIILVEEMLDKLPKEVWKRPYFKWLDPANGIGNFPICVFMRLMKSLSNYQDMYIDLRNEETRRRWILEEMLYISELDKKNCEFYKVILSHQGKYKLNIYNGNSLELDPYITWGIKKFDVIMGNPPYQAFQNASGKRGGGDLLWNKFVIFSLKNLKPSGYLCFVHPSLWRKPSTKTGKTCGLINLMTTENTMIYLSMHDLNDGKKIFNSGTRFDWYIIKKNKNTKNYKTEIKTYKKIEYINLYKKILIPNYNIANIYKLLDINENKHINEEKIIYNRTNYGTDKPHVSYEKNNNYKYTLIHATNKTGIRYAYSSINTDGHYGIRKAIFGDSGINDVILDNNGEYGMTNHSMGIPYNKKIDGIKIKKFLLSKFFKSDILDPLMFSNFGIEWRIFLYFKKDFWKEFVE